MKQFAGAVEQRPFAAIPMPWAEQAACRGLTRLMFPASGDTFGQRAAVAVCQPCPVRIACLNHAFEHNEQAGVFGGLSAKQRRHIQLGRAAA